MVRALLLLARTRIQFLFPISGSSQPCVTPVSRNLASLDFTGTGACTQNCLFFLRSKHKMYWNIHTNARVNQKGKHSSTGLRPITINKIYYAKRILYTWCYCLETHFNVFFRIFLWIDNREKDQSGGMNTHEVSLSVFTAHTFHHSLLGIPIPWADRTITSFHSLVSTQSTWPALHHSASEKQER